MDLERSTDGVVMKPNVLGFELRFNEAQPDATPAERTAGRLKVKIGSAEVWDLEWTWIELLEHLATHWKYILWEEVAPLPIDAQSLETLTEEGARFLESENVDASAEADFHAFCESHDLARAVKGAWPPSLWILRCGLRFRVWSQKTEALVDRSALVGELKGIGDQIAARIERDSDERAVAACTRWRERQVVPPKELVMIATGLAERIVVEAAGSESAVLRYQHRRVAARSRSAMQNLKTLWMRS